MLFFATVKLIKIPNFISVFYFKTKKIIIFKYLNKLTHIWLNFDFISLLIVCNKIYLIKNYFYKAENYKNNVVKSKLTMFSIVIKLFLIEIQTKIYKKLILIGVGYKIAQVTTHLQKKILLFKFGLSHFIYLKIKDTNSILCPNFNQIFIFSNSFYKTKNLSAKLRHLNIPDVFKGKGFKYRFQSLVFKNQKKSK